jgi:phage repressor protein C with HTH and peptisase S24 domain
MNKETPFAAALNWLTSQKGYGVKGRCAGAVGISNGYFSELLKGKKEGAEKVRRAIAAYFELNYEDFLALGRRLINGEEATVPASAPVQRPTPAEDPDYTTVFKAQSRLSAGGGNFVIKDGVESKDFFRTAWLSSVCSPGNALLFDVDGASMYPTISHLDTVLIDTSRREFEDDHIFAIGIGDRVLLKRLRLTVDGKIAIVSDNEDKLRYPTEERRPEEVRILGLAVWHAGVI